MNIVYHRIHLSDICNKRGLLYYLKEIFFMIPRENPGTLASILSRVFKNVTVFKKQEEATQFPVRQIGQIR